MEVGQGVGPQPGRVKCDLSDDSWTAVTRADHVTRPGVSIHYVYNYCSPESVLHIVGKYIPVPLGRLGPPGRYVHIIYLHPSGDFT